MGELEEYYIILSKVLYIDDPMKFGRIKAEIPGVVHAATSKLEAMPWIRPLRMHGYQTFSKAVVGQQILILVSKTNYNEYWWTHYHETIDLTQNFLNEKYDFQPDVFNARNGSSVDAIFTYDDKDGYIMRLGEDFANFRPDRQMKIAFNTCRVMIQGNLQYSGGTDNLGSYEPCVMGYKCQSMRAGVAAALNAASAAAAANNTPGMAAPLAQAASTLGQGILGRWHWVN